MSSASHDKNYIEEWNYDRICSNVMSEHISYDGKRIIWHDSYESLQEFIANAFTQHGKWWSPGGTSKRFDSTISDFIVSWYPGKLNSLTFNGKAGDQAKDYLIDLCMSSKATGKGHEQSLDFAVLKEYMSDFELNIEILQSRVDSLQSFINACGDDPLPLKMGNLENEATRLRLELEEEKVKNFNLDSQVKQLTEEIQEIKAYIHHTSRNKGKPIGENNTQICDLNDPIIIPDNIMHILPVNEKQGAQVSDVDKQAFIAEIAITEERNDKSQTNDNNISTNRKSTTSFDKQLEDYKIKHSTQRSNHTPTNQKTIRIPSLDQQLKDYMIKHKNQNKMTANKSSQTNNKQNNVMNKKKYIPTKEKQSKRKSHETTSQPRKPHPDSEYQFPRQRNTHQDTTQSFFHRASSPPLRKRTFAPGYHRSREWLQYLRYVNRLTTK